MVDLFCIITGVKVVIALIKSHMHLTAFAGGFSYTLQRFAGKESSSIVSIYALYMLR